LRFLGPRHISSPQLPTRSRCMRRPPFEISDQACSRPVTKPDCCHMLDCCSLSSYDLINDNRPPQSC
jgi:hypothetical protein